mgnify:CR=1 FL=1
MTFKHKFERISRLPTYVFSEINTMKAFERSRGEDVIDFGMGNPDLATPQHIVEKLCEKAGYKVIDKLCLIDLLYLHDDVKCKSLVNYE